VSELKTGGNNCDLCGAYGQQVDLMQSYQTTEVKHVCLYCLDIVEDHLRRVKSAVEPHDRRLHRAIQKRIALVMAEQYAGRSQSTVIRQMFMAVNAAWQHAWEIGHKDKKGVPS
jgi:hypothetical protein